MKKPLITFFVILVGALAGIGGWLLNSVHQSRASAEAYVQWVKSQTVAPVQFIISVPSDTPKDQTLFLSGDSSELGSWDAAGVPLHQESDGRYRVTVNLLTGIHHTFKVTRGTWGTVERGAGGTEIPDHAFTAEPGKVVNSSVLTWVDGGKSIPGKITLTGNFRLHQKFESQLLGNTRTIIVYLPPNYESNKIRRYPVLYMQDGQNLFDSSTAFAGVEWRVDETAQALITQKKIQPVIIVGIYNTPDRTAEFTPFDKTPTGAAGRGALYGRFIVDELKPMIDRTYRTIPDRDHTALAGSSMGGLITLAIAHDHPDVFGGVAVLDPWLRDSQHDLLDTWKDDAWMKGMRFYVDMGTNGGPEYPGTTEVPDFNALVQQFDSAGLKKGTDYSATIIDGAAHNESAWQQRVGNFLTFLYGQK
ncbi:MAG TPA: alpha/beta hydrolase-fold protein [Tepidisphaeraceae bacterium]|jgi:enterochelin esterase-like enzyme|nr:alpha/beta hydrolase-fold protein [Tepidisphaeraceae bacterium]